MTYQLRFPKRIYFHSLFVFLPNFSLPVLWNISRPSGDEILREIKWYLRLNLVVNLAHKLGQLTQNKIESWQFKVEYLPGHQILLYLCQTWETGDSGIRGWSSKKDIQCEKKRFSRCFVVAEFFTVLLFSSLNELPVAGTV